MRLIFFSGVLCLNIILTGCVDLVINNKNKFDYKTVLQRNEQVYAMRGGLGGIFSLGMNTLEDKLTHEYNINASSTVWFHGKSLSQQIIENYQTKKLQGPIILVGHSLGANEQISIAHDLEQYHIPVALLITLDPVMSATVSSNVKHVVNIYKPSFIPMLSGLRVQAVDLSHTKVENINVEKIKGANSTHLTMTNNRVIQKLMLDHILSTLHDQNKNLIK